MQNRWKHNAAKLTVVVISLTFIFLWSCREENPIVNPEKDVPDCLIGKWIQKEPGVDFRQNIEYRVNSTGTHQVSADHSREFTWKIEHGMPVVTYSDNNEINYVTISCNASASLYQKYNDYIKEGSSGSNDNGNGGNKTPNMKVSVNGGAVIDVFAVVDCAVIGDKQQFMIIGMGEGLPSIALNFRDVPVTVGKHELFINAKEDVNRFVGVEYAYGSDAGVIRFRPDYPECVGCGSGSITITERTVSKVKGTFTAQNDKIQFTGEFDVAITEEDCQL